MPRDDRTGDLEARITGLENQQNMKHEAIGQRLTKIEVIQDGMYKIVFGNGQPGMIVKHEERIARLEAFSIKTGAIAGALLILIEILHEVPFSSLMKSILK